MFDDTWIIGRRCALSTLVSRRAIARFGVKTTMLAGLASLAAGQLVLSRLTDDSAYLTHVLPGLILTPFGGALVFPAVSVGMTSAVTAVDRGLAGGLIPTAQQVGNFVLVFTAIDTHQRSSTCTVNVGIAECHLPSCSPRRSPPATSIDHGRR